MSPENIPAYQQLEERIIAWAGTRPELIAGVVVGSRGRSGHLPDQWSDLDLIIFSNAVEVFTRDGNWLAGFGDLWALWLSNAGSVYPEWFALYAGGLKLDIAFVPITLNGELNLGKLLAGFAFQDVLQSGVRVIFDKLSGAAEEHRIIARPSSLGLPSPAEFRAAINHFWITAARTSKLIYRDDLWRAKQACDGEMKACLLTMLEWHARAVYAPQSDIWYEGRNMSEWADPHALDDLPRTFASYNQPSLHQALLATLDLYQWLARETAARLGYEFPSAQDEAIFNWIKSV
jgi:aminoglycoside 6-adenylyltransferase